jgi:hypothetical protein
MVIHKSLVVKKVSTISYFTNVSALSYVQHYRNGRADDFCYRSEVFIISHIYSLKVIYHVKFHMDTEVCGSVTAFPPPSPLHLYKRLSNKSKHFVTQRHFGNF